ncbi:hypothetical protein [Desulfovibrio cuneatus]|uniref:hypothetical protein n=1 Tax=Desulfovibrio cuneatus TaxID=159728 RepID=UPI0003FF525C|nr:hypothetical protein [Desulfovibrio cuneatus]
MRRMLFSLFLFAGVLLCSHPALTAGSAKHNANSTQNAAPVPPAPGDIVAEFVSCYSGQGSVSCVFSEPDGNNFNILLCYDDDKEGLCGEIGISRSTFNPYDANAWEMNLGRQFIITPEKMIVEEEQEKNGISHMRWLRPSAIRLDTRPGVPRNTRVLPYQTLEGTVECVRDPYFSMYFIDAKNKRYALHGKMGFGSNGPFSRMFCPNEPGYRDDGRHGPYRFQGDVIYDEEEPEIPSFEAVSPAWKKYKKGGWKEVPPPDW